MKVMVWFYNHRDALDHLMDYTLIDSDEESDDDDAGENGLDNEDSPLDQVGEFHFLLSGCCCYWTVD